MSAAAVDLRARLVRPPRAREHARSERLVSAPPHYNAACTPPWCLCILNHRWKCSLSLSLQGQRRRRAQASCGCRAHVGSCRRRSRGAVCPRCRSGRVSSARVSRATRGMLIDLVRQPPTPHDELTSPCIFYQRVWRLRHRPGPTHGTVVDYGLCLPQRAICCGVQWWRCAPTTRPSEFARPALGRKWPSWRRYGAAHCNKPNARTRHGPHVWPHKLILIVVPGWCAARPNCDSRGLGSEDEQNRDVVAGPQ